MPDLRIPVDGLSQTALFTAWLRHEEAGRPEPLFTDPLADFLVGELRDRRDLREFVEKLRAATGGFPVYHAVRTRFFDDGIRTALDSGVRQVVTLAAGVDGRAVRLPCPPGTRWFELDLPHMTELKTALVARSGLTPACERIEVAADLRTDWAAPLREAGFDPGQPTAWLIEGLLLYLTLEEGDKLLAELSALSAPGSHLFLDHLHTSMLGDPGARMRDSVAEQDLTFRSARDDLGDWLGGAGWRARVHAADDPAIGCGRSVPPTPAGWITAATRAQAVSRVSRP